jgi:hypothetical protein
MHGNWFFVVINIIGNGVDTLWPCCVGEIESENHLFVLWPLSWEVWSLVHGWFCISSVAAASISCLFDSFLTVCRNGELGLKGILLVWHVEVWMVWRSRNVMSFCAIQANVEKIFYRIQLVSWKWLLAKKINLKCLFYEWGVNPLDYIAR